MWTLLNSRSSAESIGKNWNIWEFTRSSRNSRNSNRKLWNPQGVVAADPEARVESSSLRRLARAISTPRESWTMFRILLWSKIPRLRSLTRIFRIVCIREWGRESTIRSSNSSMAEVVQTEVHQTSTSTSISLGYSTRRSQSSQTSQASLSKNLSKSQFPKRLRRVKPRSPSL